MNRPAIEVAREKRKIAKRLAFASLVFPAIYVVGTLGAGGEFTTAKTLTVLGAGSGAWILSSVIALRYVK